MDSNDESLDRALADLELLKAAYPDEVTCGDNNNDLPSSFPLYCSLHLSPDSFVQLEFKQGYPLTSGIQVSKYRSPEKGRMEAALGAIRESAQTCLDDQVEGAFTCCAAALEAWNEHQQSENNEKALLEEEKKELLLSQQPPTIPPVQWSVSEPLVDRKSSFVARACRVTSEQQVHDALHQLIHGNSKLQRATHNMVSLIEVTCLCCVKEAAAYDYALWLSSRYHSYTTLSSNSGSSSLIHAFIHVSMPIVFWKHYPMVS